MKKLSLLILLLSLLCCVVILTACDTTTPSVQCAEGHTPVTDAAVAPTCTEPGLTEGSHCSVCRAVITAQEKVAPTGHTKGDWITQIAATCVSDGVRYTECTTCQTILSTGTISANGTHVFKTTEDYADSALTADSNGWITAKASTCTEEGVKSRECKECGYKETQTIAAAHSPKLAWTTSTPASCTTTGFQYRSCQYCDTVTHTKTLAALGHDFQTDAESSIESTCLKGGLTVKKCTKCEQTQTETVDALGHDAGTVVVDVAATCTTKGMQHTECTACHTVLSTQEINAIGHDYPATGTVVSAATCTTAGLQTLACKNGCGSLTNEVLPVIPHEEIWITDVFATCHTGGSKHKECTVCHTVLTTEPIEKVEHNADNYNWVEVIAATCQQEGLKIATCPYCSLNEQQTIPKTAHNDGNWIVDIAATCAGKGMQHKFCSTCQTITVTEEIPALPHTPTNIWITVTAPTATQSGTSKQLCSVCSEVAQTATTTLSQGVAMVDKTSTVDLSAYSIVYASSCKQGSKLYTYLTDIFRPAMNTATGKTVSMTSESSASSAATAKQILIGITSRKESATALSAVQGRGYTVRVMGNKIIILGSDELLTISAAQHFVENYLNGGKTVDVTEDATAAALPVISLASLYGSPYAYIFDADLDTHPLHMYVSDSWQNKGYTGDGRDYPVYVFEYLLARISSMSGLPVGDFTFLADTDTTYVNGYELLFGVVEREESLAFRKKLDANQYGFRIEGNKIIVAAHIDMALEPLVEKFLEFYRYVLDNCGGALPQNYEEIYTLSGDKVTGTILGSKDLPKWKLDFPRPENAAIEMAENNNDESIQIIYTGDGASADGYLAYCAALEKAGYTLVPNMQYDDVGGTGNYFRFYQNTAKNHVLYVALNSYSAQEEYANRYKNETDQYGDFIHYTAVNGDFDGNGKTDDYEITQYPMRTWKQCIRIVSAPSDTAYLPDASILTQQSYTKITNTSLTNIRIEKSVGMSYVLQLEDGRFVIIDGGGDSLYSGAENDKHILYATLSELHKRTTGSAPSESNPIHIAAWLVTHSHADHYGTITKFLNYYASSKTIKMDYLLGNFPEVSTMYPVGGDTTTMGDGRVATLQGYFTSAGLTAFKYVKAHTGMTLYFANLKMEIIMTTEDHAPFRITNSNDTNTVTKWTIASTDASSGPISAATVAADQSVTTWMVLGDSCIYASRWMCAMWGGKYNTSTKLFDGSYLKTDMVQLAHHGNIGCEISLYKSIQPTVVFFPHYASSYNSYTQDSDKNWTDTVDRYVIRELPTVEYIVVAGIVGTSYTDTITLSFTKDGINFPSSNPAWGIKFDKNTGKVTNNNVTIKYNTKKFSFSSFSYLDITYVNDSPVIKK